jgi:hypothetical protein
VVKRRKWIGLALIGVATLLICHTIGYLHRASVMRRPQVYLTQQRATQLSTFAERLLRETNCTRFELISHRWWLPTHIEADSPLTKDQLRSVRKILKENNLHLIELEKRQRTVIYGHASLRTWCYYIYTSDHGGPPQDGPWRTITRVRDNWYFAMF